ncbi:hypothetical protein Cob_v004453 [Colletotrichum orbiculare MAFF 240422]|uniref:Neurofilament medium polypeptide protein n=1 Tax=Colletotrichum orbiculare (strain 104-T / ATCC 96160 / CBS 514.97 / LARS 414 / MAFF 240422) TaxID=1213857 RepID=A0A484FYU2_COLOR|nr:hypothetical protein Cob_v004453 [Colletotrichum orbiculare MAFF 240422]
MHTSLLMICVLSTAGAGARALDISEELGMGWKMGMLPRQASQNLQTFTGDLGGVKASAITKSNNPARPFEVEGDTFPDFSTAANRACDNQKNKCSQAANNGPQKFDVSKCDEQATDCKLAIDSTTKQSFGEPVFAGTDGNFDIFCDP